MSRDDYIIDQMPSSKRHIVEGLLYAAFIAMMVSRVLLERLRCRLDPEAAARLRDERWAALFAVVAADLLALVLRSARSASNLEPFIEAVLRREAVDPNRRRLGLLARVQQGTRNAA